MDNKMITKNIINVGVDDKDIDLFESQYVVPNGVSYNSFLIKDEVNVLVDTVDKRKTEEWLKNLEQALNGEILDILIVSHMEPDHSASIDALIKKYPNIKIVGNEKTFQMINQFFDVNIEDRKIIVKDGEEKEFGSHKFKFVFAPMVHWPEVMVAYEETEKVLFAADAFGKFGALDTDEDWTCEARRYYFNIVGKYGVQVQTLLKKAATLDISIICPLHGPILKENLEFYINKYDTWSKYEPEDSGVLIAYASIHGNTKKVAEEIYKLLKEKYNVEKVAITDLSRDDMAEAVEDAFRYDKMILAASTYNMDVFTPMRTFLHELKSRNYQKRKVALIENATWAPAAARVMKAELESMKEIEILENAITVKSSMKDEDLEKLETLVRSLLEQNK